MKGLIFFLTTLSIGFRWYRWDQGNSIHLTPTIILNYSEIFSTDLRPFKLEIIITLRFLVYDLYVYWYQ